MNRKEKEPTRYWVIDFGYHGEKYVFKRPMNRQEVEAAMNQSARAEREYRYGKMIMTPVSKSRFYACN